MELSARTHAGSVATVAETTLDPRPVVAYLRKRLERQFGTPIPEPEFVQNPMKPGFRVTIPTPHGQLSLFSSSPVDVLERLEEHLVKMVALSLWKADGGIGQEKTE